MTKEEAEKQLEECECEGSMAKPWLFCDDCEEARDILDDEPVSFFGEQEEFLDS